MPDPEKSSFFFLQINIILTCTPWEKSLVSIGPDRQTGRDDFTLLTLKMAREVPFSDLMRPVGRAIHQRDSAPLFPIVLFWYVRESSVCFSRNDGLATL